MIIGTKIDFLNPVCLLSIFRAFFPNSNTNPKVIIPTNAKVIIKP